jgi:hypothetical protein
VDANQVTREELGLLMAGAGLKESEELTEKGGMTVG